MSNHATPKITFADQVSMVAIFLVTIFVASIGAASANALRLLRSR